MLGSLTIVSKSLAPYRVNFYREVARALALQGWRTTLVVALAGAKDHPWLSPGESDSILKIIEVRGELSDARLWIWLKRKLHLPVDTALPTRRLFSELEASAPDVVWTHEYSPFCLSAATWAFFRDRFTILSTEIGDSPLPYACSKRGLLLHRIASFLYQAVIAHSKEATRRSHPSGAPVIFAPHAIDTSEYHPQKTKEERPFRFLFTGSLDDRKGIRRLIEAGRLLADSGKEFEVRVLGSGPLSSWLAEQKDPWLNN